MEFYIKKTLQIKFVFNSKIQKIEQFQIICESET